MLILERAHRAKNQVHFFARCAKGYWRAHMTRAAQAISSVEITWSS